MTEEFDLLISRYLDGTTSPDELLRLDAQLRQNPAARQEFLLIVMQDAAVRNWAVTRPKQKTLGLTKRGIIVAAATFLIAAAGFLMMLLLRPDDRSTDGRSPAPEAKKAPPSLPSPLVSDVVPQTAVVRIMKLQGDVRIVTANVRTAAAEGQVLSREQVIETSGIGSFALIQIGNLSIEMAHDTRVASLVDKIELTAGFLRIDAARSACTVVTPEARAEVVAARVNVRAATDSTWIDVNEGEVRFVRRADGESIEVATDQCAHAKAGQRFQALSQNKAVDPVGIEWAVERGLLFLKNAKLQGDAKTVSRELILLAYVVAGVPGHDPEFRRLLDDVLRAPLERTYNVALQAMLLEKLDRQAHQSRILECAQYLIDNQCRNGQWSYGEPASPATLPVGGTPPPGIQGARKMRVSKRRDGGRSGDNSNSQYACLGLRACHDAGVVLPREVVEKARDWWLHCQAPAEVADEGRTARGWGYRKDVEMLAPQDGKDGVTGTMTTGALGALAICEHLLGTDTTRRVAVKEGLNWLASRFTVSENPGGSKRWHYYYLCGLERAGSLLGAESIGSRHWYEEGARSLVSAQNLDGSWTRRPERVWETCFAILFLKRTTRPLIDSATLDQRLKGEESPK